MELPNLWENLYLLMLDVFGGAHNAILDTTCQVVATLGTLFIVALPFLIVYRILKLLMGR